MKEKFKKLLASLAAIIMAVGMMAGASVPVMADDPTYNITIKGSNNNPIQSGHTYKAYQIFTGDLTEDTSTTPSRYIITNVVAGRNLDLTTVVTSYGNLVTDLKAQFTDKSDIQSLGDSSTAAEIEEAIGNANISSDSADAIKLAQVLSRHLKDDTESGYPKSSTEGENSTYTISGVAPGYYLIKDTTSESATTTDNFVYSGVLLEVLHGDKEIEVKTSIPTVEKEVLADSSWADSAVKGTGDTITYKITGTLPDGFSNYSTYTHYKFTDKLPLGVTVDLSSVKVLLHNGASSDTDFYDGEGSSRTLKSGYTDITSLFDISQLSDIKSGDDVTGHSFTVTLKSNTDLKQAQTVTGSNTQVTFSSASNIIVTYTATLNNNATTGANGNVNNANLEYSNNPNTDGSGDYGKTPDDPATVFTFTLKPTKHKDTSTGNALQGAGFTLYGTTQSGEGDSTTYTKNVNDVKGMAVSDASGNVQFYETKTDNGNLVPDTTKILHLKSGYYVLSETTTPAGYNTMNDILIHVTFSSSGTDAQATVTASVVSNEVNGTASAGFTVTGFDSSTGAAVSETPADTGVVTAALVNRTGSVLPSTGGMGTTIFYVIGGVLVAGAVILLISRKRRA